MAAYSEQAQAIWQVMRTELDRSIPEVASYPLPAPLFSGEFGEGLYNSEREYLDQLEAYKEFQGKL